MSEPNEIHQRVGRLEHQMSDVRKDAAAARILAGAADRDVSEMRTRLLAHTKILNALRETQLEHGVRLGRLEGRFDGLEGRFDGLEGRFDGLENKVDHGFSMVSVGMAQITALLTPAPDKPDKLDET